MIIEEPIVEEPVRPNEHKVRLSCDEIGEQGYHADSEIQHAVDQGVPQDLVIDRQEANCDNPLAGQTFLPEIPADDNALIGSASSSARRTNTISESSFKKLFG